MKGTLLIFSFVAILSSFGQGDSSAYDTGGLTGYYFWEEDSAGFIRNRHVSKPYLQNFQVRLAADHQHFPSGVSETELIRFIEDFAHENKRPRKKKFTDGKGETVKIPLERIASEHPSSMLFTYRNGEWISRTRANVVYFNMDEDYRLTFSHAMDSLILSTLNVRLKTGGQYMVYTYRKRDELGKLIISRQEVYNYGGQNITRNFKETSLSEPRHYLIFANGYRGPNKDRDRTDNLVTSFDRYHYWYKLDDSIIVRLQPDKTYYIDGSMGVNTSVHRSKVRFALSYLLARIFPNSEHSERILNTSENPVGFDQRKEEGKIAGRTFLETRCNHPACEFRKDTVDIVCHSMGYAYSLGFIEAVKDHVVFGSIYILAPESGCYAGTNWLQFREVWQYGSKENVNPVEVQDGVAPQCTVKGLEQLPSDKGGRVFIPADWPHQDFIRSHDTRYFHWIIERIPAGSPGYIHR